MKITKRYLTDEELAVYLQQLDISLEKVDDNYRAEALILHQNDPAQGYPKLIKNMANYSQAIVTELIVETIPVRLMLNKTRLPSLNSSSSDERQNDAVKKTCELCKLDRGQRGIIIKVGNEQEFIALTNPGITFPGDLTIAAIKHEKQLITGRFNDMIQISRALYHFSIYFNGILAGASSPHFHFQAGYKDKLIGEIQIQKLLAGQSVGQARLKRIIKSADLEVFYIENFLRPAHIIVTKNSDALLEFFEHYLMALKDVSQNIRGIKNVPDFGSLIPAFGIKENEPRLNIMLKYFPDYGGFILALFPKKYNRPSYYFRKGRGQILIGMGIKEALGNIITGREMDYNRLKNNPALISQIFSETSISSELVDTLNESLKKN
ncbi:MAG TPA: DUF4922 domain-containing protein [Candidatus Marinimicrobia bacterium]|nr:DUF4922 domain-containing protein [Candidatus Neomarinimicrobiota bacterium]HRS51559.1 DUF4922 domain-containing protein [Candidatus Neomarinimicrobiota bacterium]HRU92363.1 DUF4922 domain-containing protein [Candidatus Neomarinimicrobiota bacterium]